MWDCCAGVAGIPNPPGGGAPGESNGGSPSDARAAAASAFEPTSAAHGAGSGRANASRAPSGLMRGGRAGDAARCGTAERGTRANRGGESSGNTGSAEATTHCTGARWRCESLGCEGWSGARKANTTDKQFSRAAHPRQFLPPSPTNDKTLQRHSHELTISER